MSHHFEEFSTCFNDADFVYVADVYAAGETPIEGVSGPALAESLRSHGHRDVALTSKATLAKDVHPNIEPGDLIVCLGAGDITYWAAELPEQLGKL